MATKKVASPQAMGRATVARKASDTKRKEIEDQFRISSYRGTDSSGVTAPATYGQDKLQKKLTPIQRVQEKMYANYKNPKNALAMNRSAKAKDSGRTK